ncbi:MAG: cell division protein SepF [Actinomycetota bacterium]
MSFWKTAKAYLGLEEDGLTGEIRTFSESTGPSIEPPQVTPPPSVERSAPAEVHALEPTAYVDAQEIGDKVRAGLPVVLDLRTAGHDVSTRIVAFACGLAYAVDGGVQRLASSLYLLTPAGVRLDDEDRARVIAGVLEGPAEAVGGIAQHARVT